MTKLIIKFGKIISSIVAFTSLIAAIILIISAIQYKISPNVSTTIIGSIKIHGLTDGITSSDKDVVLTLILNSIMLVIISVSAFAARRCFSELLKPGAFYTNENVQITRKTGIFIIVIFAVIIALTSLDALTAIFKGGNSMGEVIGRLQEVSVGSLYWGIFFLIISFFIQSGVDEVSGRVKER